MFSPVLLIYFSWPHQAQLFCFGSSKKFILLVKKLNSPRRLSILGCKFWHLNTILNTSFTTNDEVIPVKGARLPKLRSFLTNFLTPISAF